MVVLHLPASGSLQDFSRMSFGVSLVELLDVLVPAYIVELGGWSLDESPMLVVSVADKVGW